MWRKQSALWPFSSNPHVESERSSAFNLGAQQRFALLATAFLFPSAGAILGLPWLLALRAARFVGERRILWIQSPFDLPLVLFLVAALIAGLLSPLRDIALGSWLLAGLGFVVMLQAALDSLREAPTLIRSLHRAFALGTLSAAVYGLVLFFAQHLDRAQLLTLGPQAFGFGLMVGIFLSLPLFEEPFPWPLIAVLTLAVSGTAVFATFNRAALYGLVAGGLTYLLLVMRRLRLRLLGAAAFSLVLGLLVAVATPAILQTLGYQLRHTGFVHGPIEGAAILRKTAQFIFGPAGNNDRLPIWQVDLRVIRRYPWFGMGLGGFRSIGHEWTVGIPGADVLPPGTPPHDLYMNLAAEVGIPGALAFLALPSIAITRALKQKDAYHVAQIACMAGMLAAEIRDGILMGYHMSLGFILILGMMGASPLPPDREVSEEERRRGVTSNLAVS